MKSEVCKWRAPLFITFLSLTWLVVQEVERFWIAAELVALIVGSVFFSAIRFRTPVPLTAEETREVTTAISAIAHGSKITNLRRDPDGSVRAFLPGEPEGGRIIVVTNRSGDWRASVETYCF